MFDQDTAALIRSTPALEGLDRKALPDFLTDAFAQIAAARVRFRGADEELPQELHELLARIRRLASTNEALVSVLPDREDRIAAAFVAATAHQLCFNADHLFSEEARKSSLSLRSISSDISAMLLFLIAEATADAHEIARLVAPTGDDPVARALIISLRYLARGELDSLVDQVIPTKGSIASTDLAESGARALYLELLRGAHVLANRLLLGEATAEMEDPIEIFRRVRGLSIGESLLVFDYGAQASTSAFSGPHHLASLLVAVSRDLTESAVTNVPPPSNLDQGKWRQSMCRIARERPFLWRNHREAIEKGYLRLGTSSAVGFPTGAGKSTLAELKINAALLSGRGVIFLCPTHALVDQTARNLAASFPTASVQGERLDEFDLLSGDDELPEIFVMTPEACLAQMSIEPSVFEDVGLLVFDECHLLHPSDNPNDRRSIDAMLCILILPKIAADIDLLLLSAMMKNTDDIAAWIAELTGRPCLSLSLAWKPTRQLRGSLVYQQQRIEELSEILREARNHRTTKHPSTEVKKQLKATPFALFSLKQTWATNRRGDYTLVRLLEGSVNLAANSYWSLTPNAVKVSSTIAVSAVDSGLKTLVFFQTIKNAASAAREMSDLLEPVSIKLTNEEARWAETAIAELGDPSHLYMKMKNGRVINAAAVHHGLLLPEERFLCEALYKRHNGIKALAATSTLAQGMNLPSELVIIGEDSRFDEATDKREILKAQELLNAAGRAGRAGEGASGIVLVVPGKVVGIDLEAATIGSHWSSLRKIFGQSDQCLTIDDPLTAVLDRVHAGLGNVNDIDKYTIARLASGGDEQEKASTLAGAISSSFGGYLARKKEDAEWLEQRIQTATSFFNAETPETEREIVQNQVAASLGLSLELVSRLSLALEVDNPGPDGTVPTWRKWFFKWLWKNPDLLEHVFRPETLAELFGRKKYEALESVKDKAAYALPRLSKLVWLWMRGDPLRDMEQALGTKPSNLKTCDRARRFVLRVVPELAFLFGLPAFLHDRLQAGSEEPEPLSAAQSQLGRCVRYGFNFHEKAALAQVMRKARFSRRQLHQYYAQMKPYLAPATPGETWEQALLRVEEATDDEVNARGLDH